MDVSYILDKFWSERESHDIAQDNIEFLLENTFYTLEENELSKLEIPFAVDLAMNKLQTMLDLALMEYDGKIYPQIPFENLEADGEPYPNTIDSWARGTVTTRKVVADPDALHKKIPTASSTPSVSSYRSTATGRSRGTAGTNTRSRGNDKRTVTSSGSHGFNSTGNNFNNPDDKTGQIMELDEGLDGEFADLNATGFMFDALLKMKKKKSMAYFELKEETGEFEQLQEQIDKAAKEMRGKKFVLDRYGQPVLIGKVNADTLPKFTVELTSNVTDNIQVASTPTAHSKQNKHTHEQHSAANNNDRPLSSGRGNKQNKRVIRIAGSRNIETDSFQPTLSLATSLSKVDSIPKVSAGVAVRNKLSSKVGEVIPEDQKHISRQTYLAKTMNRDNSVGRSSPHSFQYETDDFSFNNNNTNNRNLLGRSKSQANNALSSSSGISSENISVLQNIDFLPDINPLEGSRVLEPIAAAHDLSDEELGLGPINSTTSANGYQQLSPNSRTIPKVHSKHKENVSLLRNNQNNLGVPKDRDLPRNMKKVVERKHLPAPPLGYTMGHGLVAPNNLHNNVIQKSSASSLQQGSQSGVSISFDSVSSGSEWHKPMSRKL